MPHTRLMYAQILVKNIIAKSDHIPSRVFFIFKVHMFPKMSLKKFKKYLEKIFFSTKFRGFTSFIYLLFFICYLNFIKVKFFFSEFTFYFVFIFFF